MMVKMEWMMVFVASACLAKMSARTVGPSLTIPVVRVGMYTGPGTGSPGNNSAYRTTIELAASDAFGGKDGYTFSVLYPKDLQELKPFGSSDADFDILTFPGGSGNGQAEAIGEVGMAKIREFVAAGGGYMGTCGGAFLGLQHILFYGNGPEGKGPPTQEPWDRGHGVVEVEFTSNGSSSLHLNYANKNMSITYWQGPIVKDADIPENVTRFAFYRTEIDYNHHNETKGEMINTPAITGIKFGKGAVILTSPHPELDPYHPEVYRGEMQWVVPPSLL